RFPAWSSVHLVGAGRRNRPSRSTAHEFPALERRDRVDDLLCGHDRTGIVREINVESGVHLLIRVIRRCVFYHRDVIAELSGKANRRFDAGVGYESDHDELMDAVLLELQIQIRVGEAAGTPVLRCDGLAWL